MSPAALAVSSGVWPRRLRRSTSRSMDWAPSSTAAMWWAFSRESTSPSMASGRVEHRSPRKPKRSTASLAGASRESIYSLPIAVKLPPKKAISVSLTRSPK